MPAPSVGTTWVSSGLGYFDGSRARRGGLVAVLIRDYVAGTTDLSPGGAFASPFALDGQLRNDLLITTPVAVSATNQGFWLAGAISPAGVSRKPKVTSDDLMILQSNNPIRSDIQEESKTISFTAFENKPLIDRLRMNKTLTGIEDVGATAYFQGKPASAPFQERQIILIRSDSAGGLVELTAEPYPRCVLRDIGEAKMTKKDADAHELTFEVLLDPFFVDTNGVPLGDAVWREGAGWRAGGGVPVFPGAAPVAAPTTAAHATLTFTNCTDTGASDVDGPFTFTGEVSVNSGSTWAAGSIQTSVIGASTTVLTFQTLAANATTKLRAIATLPNGASTTSQNSNTITVT